MNQPTRVDLDLLFETSWEVCNKIGGIYTVLSTKAKTLQKLYKDRVIFIGPDVWDEENPCDDFIASSTPLKAWLASANLPKGVSVRVGRWNVPGRPVAVLVKFSGLYADKNDFYGEMWRRFGVDSLHAYGDYDEGCAFARAAGMVIESITNFRRNFNKRRVVAHFDEWTTAMGLLYLKWQMPEIGTVFTTHATCIGRSICGNNKPLYDYLKGYDGDQMARELNMEAKHSLEKAAAHNADCFTTVSEVTATECEQLLGLRPQVVTPNGFEGDFVPALNKMVKARQDARATLINVANSLTGRKYDNGTFLVATSGRCEYRNKGLDVFLDALHTLDGLNPKGHVLAFVLVPAWCKGPRADLRAALTAKTKRCLENPAMTHDIYNPDSDAIACRIRQLRFDQNSRAKVDVIYVPCYLKGSDGIFDKTYYELLPGFDATVFPSYYEPWGYTPLESIAFGVPTVTTTLSGFGQWVLDSYDNQFDDCGVNVIGRTDGNYAQVVATIAESIRYLTLLGTRETTAIRRHAMATAGSAAWANFISYYIDAYEKALERAEARVPAPVAVAPVKQ